VTDPAEPTRPPNRLYGGLGGNASPVDGLTGRPASPESDRTDSPVGKPDVPTAAAAIAAVITMGLVGVAWVLRRQGKRLRRPTKTQMHDITTPLARVALRLTDLSAIDKTTVDLLTAGGAIGVYVSEGPLVTPATDDPNLPDNLQE
jgi:hypothetical protein